MDTAERVTKLMRQCTEVDVFELEGVYFLGYYPEVIKEFVKNNPHPSDFYVWVTMNYSKLEKI